MLKNEWWLWLLTHYTHYVSSRQFGSSLEWTCKRLGGESHRPARPFEKGGRRLNHLHWFHIWTRKEMSSWSYWKALPTRPLCTQISCPVLHEVHRFYTTFYWVAAPMSSTPKPPFLIMGVASIHRNYRFIEHDDDLNLPNCHGMCWCREIEMWMLYPICYAIIMGVTDPLLTLNQYAFNLMNTSPNILEPIHVLSSCYPVWQVWQESKGAEH